MPLFQADIEALSADYPEYEFLSTLTLGAQKAAFKVRDKGNGKLLCFKLISPACDIERIQREIECLLLLSHPTIVKLRGYTYELKPGKTRHYSLEEFVEGTDLEAVLKGGKMSLAQAASLFACMSDGLHELYRRSIVHSDLKPSNVIVKRDGTPVLIDFGLARLLTLPPLITRPTERVGTPLYFAPEQWRGTRFEAEHRTDLFTFGLVLYQAVTGKDAFFDRGMTESQVEEAVCSSDKHVKRPEFMRLPAAWRELIGSLLEKEKAQRPDTAKEVGSELRLLARRHEPERRAG